jgi:hypothetical protein
MFKQYQKALAEFKLAVALLTEATAELKKGRMSAYLFRGVDSPDKYNDWIESTKTLKEHKAACNALVKDRLMDYKVAYENLLNLLPEEGVKVSIPGEEVVMRSKGIVIGYDCYTPGASFVDL